MQGTLIFYCWDSQGIFKVLLSSVGTYLTVLLGDEKAGHELQGVWVVLVCVYGLLYVGPTLLLRTLVKAAHTERREKYNDIII